MSDKTLSQRLRELREAVVPKACDEHDPITKMLDQCIAQAEAQEAQAGEYEVGRDPVSIALARNNASLMEWRGEKTKASAPKMLTDDEIDRVTDALGLGSRGRASFRAGLRYARDHGYLRPSQAIGEQTPVAWIYEDTLPEGYPYDAMFPYSEVRDFVRMFPVYGPSPLSSEARDLAIEALVAALSALRGELKQQPRS